MTSFAANRRQTDADTPGIQSLFRKSLVAAAAAVIAHINPLPSLRPPRPRPSRRSFHATTQMCTLPFSPKLPDVCEQSHPPRLGVSFFFSGGHVRASFRDYPTSPPTCQQCRKWRPCHITYIKTMAAAVTTMATTADRAGNCTERCGAAAASASSSASTAAGQGWTTEHGGSLYRGHGFKFRLGCRNGRVAWPGGNSDVRGWPDDFPNLGFPYTLPRRRSSHQPSWPVSSTYLHAQSTAIILYVYICIYECMNNTYTWVVAVFGRTPTRIYVLCMYVFTVDLYSVVYRCVIIYRRPTAHQCIFHTLMIV